ncbi:MAG: lipoyl(octanoyl) transferase LipB [Defluviicoccus sp.]
MRSDRPVPYPEAVAAMESRVAAIRHGGAAEVVWLLEHPSLYTAGTSAADEELLDRCALPVFRSGRGGRFTYHGPGQRVAYVMLDLKRRGIDIRAFVHGVEEWIIRTLAGFAIPAERRQGRVGVWVPGGDQPEAKIAAIGVRVRQGVTYHGCAINLDPDLRLYAGIVPCGLAGYAVTSMAAQGVDITLAELDAALIARFAPALGLS